MAKTRVVLNHEAFRRLLTSPEIEAEIHRRAEKIARRAGGDVLPNDRRRERAGSTVTARDSAKLLGSLDAGRG